MSRFLFVVPPLVGHIMPTVAIGRELADRGNQVAWAGHAETVGPLLPPGARLLPVAADFGGETLAQLRRRSLGLRGAAAFRFLWADFLIPLAVSMLPGVAAAVDEFRPDVLVADQQAPAGALVARRRGLPWATSATTSAELTDQFSTMPQLGGWARQRLTELQAEVGVSDPIDLRFSDQLVLAFSTPTLVGPIGDLPGHWVFVGPAIGTRTGGTGFPWDWLCRDRQHVLVSLGTVNQEVGRRFFATAVQAVAPLADRLQAIVVAPSDLVETVPEHVLVREFVPQLDLLPHLDAVVCHGGHNTVCEALAHGVPLVVAPIRDDQPVIAGQVVNAGAGIRVHFGRVGVTELRDAITTVLDDPSYRAAARRVQTSFTTAGGAAAAADHLEKLT
ncbi:MAG: glycosyltransferase family 1 protein [Pseudonocardiales bacterium]|nr:glycosyltransferase family 1 protein [Pseudonocardiales bacterium]MBV9032308.1 glycosyltransferase family 1 protein [Pseudonocardiales bacterium]MBW0010191.1 glycosyltransferase family 1 protein [Pseudonocardiales bacterium]